MTVKFVPIPGLTPSVDGVLTGSTAINGSGQDVDIAVYGPLLGDTDLAAAGYALGGKEYGDSDFTSYRNGETNLLVFSSHKAYAEFIRATSLCIALREAGGRPLNKWQRVLVFEFMRRSDVVEALDKAAQCQGQA